LEETRNTRNLPQKGITGIEFIVDHYLVEKINNVLEEVNNT